MTEQFSDQSPLPHKEIIVDVHGLERPEYQIAGHAVVFENSLERSAFGDALHAEAGDSAEARLVVGNTPGALVAAAAEFTADPDRRDYLSGLMGKLEAGDYADPEVLDIVDGTLGAISIDDDGKPRDHYDSDGFAQSLLALTGNAQAEAAIAAKRDALRAAEYDRETAEITRLQERLAARRESGPVPEAIPLDKLALVYTTPHAIERDAAGNVILMPAAQKRDDGFPRASLHFTVNSRVFPHAQAAGNWGTHDRLIVANMADTMESSQKAPDNLNGVDTWFNAGPGEHITLPGAQIVEAAAEGDLVAETEQGFTFLAKDTYDAAEAQAIAAMAQEAGLEDTTMFTHPAEVLKEVALRKAMEKAGVPTELQDVPSMDGHGMVNRYIGDRMDVTAAQLGLRSGKHFDTGEYQMEADLIQARANAYVQPVMSEQWSQGQWTFADSVPLAMRRQALVSGYTPSRPNTIQQSSVDGDMEALA